MRLLDWNVQWCRGVDGRVDPARIAAEAKRLADPDVICLQEVAVGFHDLPGSRGENQVDALKREFEGYHAFFAGAVDVPGKDGRRRRFGNMLLSRLPVGRVLRHALPWCPSSEAPSMPRGAIEAVIEAPFGALRVITTHLEYYSGAQRAVQIDRLGELYREADRPVHAKGEGPFQPLARPVSALVCGDFNLPPQDPLHQRMIDIGFVDAWQALNPRGSHPHTFRVHERDEDESPYCCDYVFVTEDLVARLKSLRVDGANQASDHQPLIVELE